MTLTLFLAGGLARAQSLPHVNDNFWWQPFKASVSYGAASFQATYYASDLNYFVFVNSLSPLVDVYEPARWDQRCTGTKWLARIPFPTDFVLPDAAPPETPNNPLTVYNTDTGQVWRLNGAARPVAGGSVWAYMGNATHGGSGLSGGEVTGDELSQGHIPHALAVNVWAQKFLSFSDGIGYVAPAIRADSYASSTTYGGMNPLIKMGSKLGIPASVTASSLGITSPDAVTILQAFQEFGAYIVDDTAWDAFAINADPTAGQKLNAAWTDILKIYKALEVVTGESDVTAPSPSPSPPTTYSLSLPGNQFSSRPVGSDASNGVWALYTNGTMAHSFSIPASANYKVIISAYGTPASKIWPSMTVKVDNSISQTFSVKTSTALDFTSSTLVIPMSAGTHTVSVSFTNDKSSRDLYVTGLRVIQQ